ncbi:EF-hand domain-containing protein [Mesorhizobium sp. 43Arga]
MKKVFAMLDKNNGGKIENSELPKGLRFGPSSPVG